MAAVRTPEPGDTDNNLDTPESIMGKPDFFPVKALGLKSEATAVRTDSVIRFRESYKDLFVVSIR